MRERRIARTPDAPGAAAGRRLTPVRRSHRTRSAGTSPPRAPGRRSSETSPASPPLGRTLPRLVAGPGVRRTMDSRYGRAHIGVSVLLGGAYTYQGEGFALYEVEDRTEEPLEDRCQDTSGRLSGRMSGSDCACFPGRRREFEVPCRAASQDAARGVRRGAELGRAACAGGRERARSSSPMGASFRIRPSHRTLP